MHNGRLDNGHATILPNLNTLVIDEAGFRGKWPALCLDEVASRQEETKRPVAVLAKLEFRECGEIHEEYLDLFKAAVATVTCVNEP